MIISKKPPYQNTEVDPEKTQSDINKLLRSYGVSVFQWTTDYDNNKIVLSMKVETPDQRKVECGKLVRGEICYGDLVEVGLPEPSTTGGGQ